MAGRLSGIVIATVLTGCAVVNEGAVDLRRTLSTTTTQPTDPNEALPLALRNFSLGANAQFGKEGTESLSIHLRGVFIKDFFELLPSPLKDWRKTGEIAVVANAFEMETGKELDFKDLTAGRLVFYSDDVEKGQFLNFNNLPVYGPKRYEGGPVALRFTIFELDSSPEQAKAVLGALAQVGSAAYPPAAPVLGLLNKLGESLASGKTNDIIFRYEMVLDHLGGFSRLRHFVLEAGNYVLVRSEDRQAVIPWDKLVLRENEGKLYWKDTGTLYAENTYLVFEINKDVSSRQIDLAQNTFKELLDALDREDKVRAEGIRTAVGPLVEEVLGRRVQVDNFGRAKDALRALKERLTATDQAALANNREDTATILSAIAASVNDDGRWEKVVGNNPAALSDRDVRYFVRQLRQLAQDSGKLTTANTDLFTEKGIKKAKSEDFKALLDALWK